MGMFQTTEAQSAAFRDTVPDEFMRGDNHPVARTVGELRKQLARLPEELPVRVALGDSVMLVVPNTSASYFNPFLSIRENDQDE